MELWLPWQHIAAIDLTLEKYCHHSSSFNFLQIAFILADNKDRYKISIKFDFGLNRFVHLEPLSVKKFVLRLNMKKMLSSR